MTVRLLVFGRQGAGKGTQCVKLAEHYNAPHISTGDMLRSAAEAGTPVGLEAKGYIDAGKLLPDDVMLQVIEERFAQDDVVQQGFLLDGFPRTLGQAEALVGLTPIDAAINLDVPEDVVLERMIGRGRADDNPESIANRLAAYMRETVPAIEWFDSKGLLTTVDGLGTPDEITARLITAIDARLGR
jgi:adenylate kinase